MERQELNQRRAAAPRFKLIRPDRETFHMEKGCWEHLDSLCTHKQINRQTFYKIAAKQFPGYKRSEAVPALILTWLRDLAEG